MPPKKKGAAGRAAKAAKVAAAATPPPAAVPDTVTTSRGKEYETTAALSRPRRESAIMPSPSELKKAAATPTKKRGRPAKAATEEEPPKKRGRPAKDADAELEIELLRKRGRFAKKVAEKVEQEEVDEDVDEEGEEEIDESVAAPKPRGCPPKKTAAKAPVKAAPSTTKKRGRPSKAATAAAADDGEAEEDVEESAEENEAPLQKRGRGRPAKKYADAVPKEETGPPKKRGSSPRGGETTKMAGDDDAAADQLEDELVDSAEQTASDRQYWLMKAEQEDREEQLANGEMFNAKFTIDDLRVNTKLAPEPWDGVRNPTAAKNMRAMKKGDLAFFYASGGKSGRKPGITGITEIVKEHEPDHTTADESSYGYVEDEKARGKWCLVHVEYRNKLSKPVHLAELQKYMAGSGVLSNMQVLKQTRLSVTSVSEKEWKFITEKLVEGFEEDDEDALLGAEGSNGTSNLEEESTLITIEQADGDVVINESTQPEQDLPPGALPNEPVLPNAETEVPSTDTIFPAETSQTSRPASCGGSRAPSVKAKATTSRQSSRAGSVASASLAVPTTSGRPRSRTLSARAGSAVAMPAIGEDDE